jgi:hypothetical protein
MGRAAGKRNAIDMVPRTHLSAAKLHRRRTRTNLTPAVRRILDKLFEDVGRFDQRIAA